MTLEDARSLDVLFTEPHDLVIRVIGTNDSVPGKRGQFAYHGGAFGPEGLLYLTSIALERTKPLGLMR